MNFADLILVILLLAFAMLIAFAAGAMMMAWGIKKDYPDFYNIWMSKKKEDDHED